MNIGLIVLMIIGGVTGLLFTLYICVSLFAVLIYKFYRKFRYGRKLYD